MNRNDASEASSEVFHQWAKRARLIGHPIAPEGRHAGMSMGRVLLCELLRVLLKMRPSYACRDIEVRPSGSSREGEGKRTLRIRQNGKCGP